MKIIYKDGTEESFDANVWTSSQEDSNYPEGIIALIKRLYDDDGDSNEEDDKEVVLLNLNEIRCLKLE